MHSLDFSLDFVPKARFNERHRCSLIFWISSKPLISFRIICFGRRWKTEVCHVTGLNYWKSFLNLLQRSLIFILTNYKKCCNSKNNLTSFLAKLNWKSNVLKDFGRLWDSLDRHGLYATLSKKVCNTISYIIEEVLHFY